MRGASAGRGMRSASVETSLALADRERPQRGVERRVRFPRVDVSARCPRAAVDLLVDRSAPEPRAHVGRIAPPRTLDQVAQRSLPGGVAPDRGVRELFDPRAQRGDGVRGDVPVQGERRDIVDVVVAVVAGREDRQFGDALLGVPRPQRVRILRALVHQEAAEVRLLVGEVIELRRDLSPTRHGAASR